MGDVLEPPPNVAPCLVGRLVPITVAGPRRVFFVAPLEGRLAEPPVIVPGRQPPDTRHPLRRVELRPAVKEFEVVSCGLAVDAPEPFVRPALVAPFAAPPEAGLSASCGGTPIPRRLFFGEADVRRGRTPRP